GVAPNCASTAAAVGWAGLRFGRGWIDIDGWGKLDLRRDQQPLTLSLPQPPGFPAALPTMQLTVPAFEVHVDPGQGTYQLLLDPTLTIPGFSQSLNITPIPIGTNGDFTQTLTTTNLALGDVLRIGGALVFER